MSGIFDWRYELQNIETGMRRDLQREVGQSVPWYVFDSASTVIDPVYDSGSKTSGGGRHWKQPVMVRVMSAVKLEASEQQNDRGLYTVSTLKLAISVRDARIAGLADLVFNPEAHVLDRIVYENKVFGIDQVRTRGILSADYAVIGVDATQVKAEELVNDQQSVWGRFMSLDQD